MGCLTSEDTRAFKAMFEIAPWRVEWLTDGEQKEPAWSLMTGTG